MGSDVLTRQPDPKLVRELGEIKARLKDIESRTSTILDQEVVDLEIFSFGIAFFGSSGTLRRSNRLFLDSFGFDDFADAADYNFLTDGNFPDHAAKTAIESGRWRAVCSFDPSKCRNRPRSDSTPAMRILDISIISTGNGQGFALQTIDITESRKLEELMAGSLQRYRHLFNSSADSILVFTMDGQANPERLLYANETACAKFGYSKGELLNKHPEDIIPGSRKFSLFSPLFEQNRLMFNIDAVSKDGTTVPLEINSRLLQFSEKFAVLCVARDISERESTTAPGIPCVDSKLSLTAGMLRDISDYMIQSLLDLAQLRKNALLKDESAPWFNRIVSRLVQSRNYVCHLYVISTPGSLSCTKIDLRDLVHTCLAVIKTAYPHKITLDSNVSLWSVVGDSSLLSQVFINILDNACLFSAPDSAIRIKCRNLSHEEIPAGLNGKFVEISVADQGAGIRNTVLDTIYHPYYTTIPSRHGLGLTVAQSIIKAHGGDIKVSSSHGVGSTFTLFLPAGD
ncbi:MAG: ATP-binding protein [Candidatus Wallbacteria bacterium]|nr:ATP-binding protein [Candidatus Wallbacteria bacterium]